MIEPRGGARPDGDFARDDAAQHGERAHAPGMAGGETKRDTPTIGGASAGGLGSPIKPPASRARKNHTSTAKSAHTMAELKNMRGLGKKETNITSLSRQGSGR